MEPNELIGDRYELGEPIGRGGMATIHKAIDMHMHVEVAIKILREVYSSDPKLVTRFQREARAASALQHPNIVQVYDYGQSGDAYYIVMELVIGADLRKYLKREGVLTPDRAVEIAHDVALGLGVAHRRGTVHRDVKPANILLNEDGLVKLTDFGLASIYVDAERAGSAISTMTLGAVQYYAPEQAQGEIVTPAGDIYALGIIMYEMLTGRTPFDGDTPVAVAMKHIQEIPEPPSRINQMIPRDLERIILRCLEKDPRERYPNGDALAYALDQFARGPTRRFGSSGTGRPLDLPGIDARPQPGRGASQFGASAVISGPRRGLPPSDADANDGYDAPTFEDYDGGLGNGNALSTTLGATARGTVPRISGPPDVEYELPRRSLFERVFRRPKDSQQSNSLDSETPPKAQSRATRPVRVFISYKSEDRPQVANLAGALRGEGYEIWFDQQLMGGQPWWDEIIRNIQLADVFLFILTPASLISKPCQREYEYAEQLKKRILPLLVVNGVNTSLLPPALQRIQFVDFRLPANQGLSTLVESMRKLPPAKPLPSPLPPPPEVPLSPLGEINLDLDAKTIPPEKQAQIVLSLKALLKEQDTADSARTLLLKLAKHQDVRGPYQDEIRDILK